MMIKYTSGENYLCMEARVRFSEEVTTEDLTGSKIQLTRAGMQWTSRERKFCIS